MRKTIFTRLLAVCLVVLILCSASIALADTNVTKIRTLDRGASLRSDPWVGENNKIAGVHANTTLDVYDEVNGWYYVYYNGMWGYVASCNSDGKALVTIVATNNGYGDYDGGNYDSGNYDDGNYDSGNYGYTDPTSASSYAYDDPYDMGVPYLNGRVYRLNQMNMAVYWVQVQLKATGIWYQGESWDCTGNLGDHTMSEIASFMRSRGYRGHSGVVDQSVVDELASYLEDRLEPVYVGGFYDAMDSIMVGGSSGSMYQITSNLRDMVARESIGARWVQVVLKRLGYYNSTIDGKYGEVTDRAVKAFQRDHGFQERDYITLGVARAMLEQYYYRGFSVNELP